MATTVRVDLPQRFHDDHTGRDLPGGTIVKTLARTYRVDLTREEYDEILSDAEHYAGDAMSEWVSEDFASAMSVVHSARATVRVLKRTPRPEASRPAQGCEWFAMCTNPATHDEPHPILGSVPACDRCPKIGA